MDELSAEVDILGIGFGPSNLSLAIAIEEMNDRRPDGGRLTARFVDTRPRFGWHDGMLLPGVTMQISFLKDLVSMRTPTSSFTFLNYLQEQGRLTDFINLKTFFPTRREFHGYLSWAASRIGVPVSYGTRATRIDWNGERFEVTLESVDDAAQVTRIAARNVVLGSGIRPVLPEGIAPGPRVFHNHQLLNRLAELPSRQHGRFLVVGSGQSAAEVAAYLHDSYPDAEVHASFRRFGYSPSDDTPYANRIFDPQAVDEFYTAPPELKQRLLDYHGQTNYSAVDADLIKDLYQREYDESTRGVRRLIVHRVTEVERLSEGADGVTVTIRDLGDRGSSTLEVDAAVFATGFRAADTRSMLGPSIDASSSFEGELPVVERDYRLRLPSVPGLIFLNGGVQHSHGLTSSLLSNVAVRAADILRAVTEDHHATQQRLSAEEQY
ncbi:lysine N(6)-hydroxylase/L-ornithine N(5)-oxygenase family protein [Kribbella sandramycini]|uniref:L-lysine N6-monooxygenase MbtG n=1 Tax=Kribbella sandramycini TaxID=60450 RepID=A0A7Y4L2W6_9ACTN|nr:SidA/IucD/PvdA family monooxygenase [Kribbella sandramycini]MBB6571219.1 L-ornithine N5-oxygenase [Kribbella sandramycini]NOL43374.1 lysine N(6)-hydroxylase/L-ornithine N(5)-oxygenase family protein [Kribbella sandramycini]